MWGSGEMLVVGTHSKNDLFAYKKGATGMVGGLRNLAYWQLVYNLEQFLPK